MDEAECNRRGESKILTVFRLFIIEIPYIEKQHSYRLFIDSINPLDISNQAK